MAYRAVTLKLDDYDATKLAAKAEALGVSVEQLATSLVSNQLFDHDDFTWINGDPREDTSEVDEEGARDWSEVRPEFMALIEKTFGPE